MIFEYNSIDIVRFAPATIPFRVCTCPCTQRNGEEMRRGEEDGVSMKTREEKWVESNTIFLLSKIF